MIQRFASASAVASVVIALGAGGLCLDPVPNLESRHLLTSIWCMVPLAWGLCVSAGERGSQYRRFGRAPAVVESAARQTSAPAARA